jgi:hypothetical protein
MQWKKITLSAALVILSIPFVIGGFSESNAQSNQSVDLSQPRILDRIQASGYIASKPIPSWGTIIRSKEGAANLVEGEVVYIRLELGKEVQVGDRFSIVRLGKPVIHPVTQQNLGLLVLAPGELTILERKNEIAIAKINKSYAPISLGDMILPAKPVLPETAPIRTQKKIEGVVVFSPENTVAISEKEIVFIDRGSKAGVMVGDLFSIYQRPARSRGVYGEPKEEMKELPLARVGEVVVVSVQPETSTALVTRSLQPIFLGDLAVSGTE